MRVLFLGNSYTFYNDVPGQVAALWGEAGTETAVDQVVEGGADWSMHAGRLGGLARIAEGWDVVVLQGRSTDPLLESRRFRKYGQRLAEAARDVGARVVLYQTWAWAADHPSFDDRWSKRSPAKWLDVVRDAYAALGRKVGAEVSPVGDAWARCIARHPELDLYDEDRHHSSPLGSHLAACVLFGTLSGEDPRLMAWTPEGVSAEESQMLKDVAAAI